MMTLYSPAAVAAIHGVSAAAVKYAIARGDLRAVPIIGPTGAVATWAIRAEDARAWVPRAYPR